MNQKKLNGFRRLYFDLSKRRYPNHIVHDPKTSPEHRRLVSEICEWATQMGFTFYTRVYTKWGEIIDIVIPELPRPFVEVRHSEEKKVKEYLSDYDDKRIFVDTRDPYKLL